MTLFVSLLCFSRSRKFKKTITQVDDSERFILINNTDIGTNIVTV